MQTYLGRLMKILDKFFEENNGYNDKMLVDYLNDIYSFEDFTIKEVIIENKG